MTVQVHYGGVRYALKDSGKTAEEVDAELTEIVATGDSSSAYHFQSDEGDVTIFPLLGPVAVLDVAPPRKMPPPPAPRLLPRDQADGPSFRGIGF
ncbi:MULTISPECIES: hypothetical protein [Microbacterium]|uniref:hypothetical protein n=1 Tax=Microbacterium TaxID=33882 RepID=UPI002789A04C|nr:MULTISPECIES: hypothetical protein [Microbacterium]MDQ1082837.1 hypothetical protein [Microbacterium sp. SORGH_AS_0344]MDQ1168394.1 hypothetical protein [Microbacterium proteolyticum]